MWLGRNLPNRHNLTMLPRWGPQGEPSRQAAG